MLNRYYVHKEGYASILWAFVLACIMIIFAIACPWTIWIKWGIGILFIVLFFMILSFFRMPKNRKYIPVENALMVPADGEVVHLKKVYESEYFKDERLQVSIFMSPMNVHVNRYPLTGVVKYFKYHPGRYLVAWHHKSSLLNERTTVVIENKKGQEV
ncbi:MAG: phosphatidylserine decarboxylase, partial [Bacteroidales bacterium]